MPTDKTTHYIDRPSAKAVQAATAPGYHWFRSPAGLAVRVRESGARAFYQRVVVNGRQVIKHVAPIDADLATVIADAKARIAEAAAGRDPFVAEAPTDTILGICLKHVDFMRSVGTKVGGRSTGKKLTDTEAVKVRDYYRRVLKVHGLGSLKPRALSKERLASWFRTLSIRTTRNGRPSGGPVAANRARAMLLAALSSEGADFDPRIFNEKATKAHTEQPRERHLAEDESGRLLEALDAAPLVWRTFFIILASTGLRKGELRRARIEHLVGDRLTIPGENRKNGKSLTVTLDQFSMALLTQLKQERPPFGGWLFPSLKKPGAPIKNMDDDWQKIRDAAGLPGLRIHDLRRSYGTFAGQAGASAEQIAAALGNSSLVAARHYLKLAGNQAVVDGVQQKALSKLRGGAA